MAYMVLEREERGLDGLVLRTEPGQRTVRLLPVHDRAGGLPAKLGKDPATPIDHLSALPAGPVGPAGSVCLGLLRSARPGCAPRGAAGQSPRYLGAGGPAMPGSPAASHLR